MSGNLSVRAWQEKFNLLWFDNPDRRTQIDAGWYDWFCKDTSLANKTKKMGNIIRKVKDGGKVNLDTSYVWFKNNCPLDGPLFDDFRFADIKTGEVLLTIQIDCCWNNSKFAVFGRRRVGDHFETETPLFECHYAKDLVNWLNTPWED